MDSWSNMTLNVSELNKTNASTKFHLLTLSYLFWFWINWCIFVFNVSHFCNDLSRVAEFIVLIRLASYFSFRSWSIFDRGGNGFLKIFEFDSWFYEIWKDRNYKLVLRLRLKSNSKYFVFIRLPSIGFRKIREISGIRNDEVLSENVHFSHTLQQTSVKDFKNFIFDCVLPFWTTIFEWIFDIFLIEWSS